MPSTPDRWDISAFEGALDTLLASIPTGPVSRGSRRRLLDRIRLAVDRLLDFSRSLDRVQHPETVFDPFRPEVLGRFTAQELIAQQRRSMLNDIPDFYGSGVYAIYYTGSFPAYELISGKDWPIYVGKADPQDDHAASPEKQGVRLSKRLREHKKSIALATNLGIEDFECRFLVVKSGLQKAAEDFLLAQYRPVWNNEICNGFGKHGDSAETRRNKRSEWDTLHPGRRWAGASEPNQRTDAQIIDAIREHLSRQGRPRGLDDPTHGRSSA